MKPRTAFLLGSALLGATAAYGVTAGCSASNNGSELPAGASTGTTSVTGGGGAGAFGAYGGAGGVLFGGNGGSGATSGGTGGGQVDPCASECGPVELCDGIHAGIDDNCNGVVDEGCPCATGMVESCFKGDPAYADKPGCFPGTQHCTEFGLWGECIGGVHATDHCYQAQQGCHAITAYPFQTVNLKDGTGNFSDDAQSEHWTVDCPPGVSPCPAVTGSSPADDFQPLQSGEYTVHYTKQTANGVDSCDYPLFVGAPGLRVELEWEHDLGGTGVDLDLHMHKPQNTQPWKANGGSAVDCAYDNCTVDSLNPLIPNPFGPEWFNGVAPPDPVSWYLDPVFEKNTCYFAPRGRGADWQAMGAGCHNPRLDLDNIICDPAVLDVNDANFCAPENVNIDYPPANQWIRVGVHYYWNHGQTYDVHPRIRIFCNAELMAELGPQGYAEPVTFTPADGPDPSTNLFWVVADVRFLDDPCVSQKCEVQTIYQDANLHTAWLTHVPQAHASFAPPYPP
jgi:hypothetical protein